MADEKLNTTNHDQPTPEEIASLIKQDQVKKMMEASLKTEEDVLLQPVPDRRKLPHMPDSTKRRTHVDRRGCCEHKTETYEQSKAKEDTGRRYVVNYPLQLVVISKSGQRSQLSGTVCNISGSGMLCEVEAAHEEALREAQEILLTFEFLF